jgi:phosphate transport system substrate-binding protein
MNMRHKYLATAAIAIAMLASGAVPAAEITAAGTAFLAPAVANWSDADKRTNGDTVSYRAVGSGAALQQAKSGAADFAIIDLPLSAEELRDGGLVQFPVAMSAVVVVVNIPGVQAGRLHLDGPTLASIFLGKVTRWNDPAIARTNPGVALPDLGITPVHHSDTSGSPLLFTTYLLQASAEWRDNVGAGSMVSWPNGLGGKESDTAIRMAIDTVGSIAYGKMSTATKLGAAWVSMASRDGSWVTPDTAAIQSAAANADWTHSPLLVNQRGSGSWPLVGASFAVLNPQSGHAKSVLRFFEAAYATQAADGGIPLPPPAVRAIEDGWPKSIRSADGSPLLNAR